MFLGGARRLELSPCNTFLYMNTLSGKEGAACGGGGMCKVKKCHVNMYVCMYDYIAVSTRTLTPPTTGTGKHVMPVSARYS